MVRFVAFGFLGSGKTLLMVKEAYRHMKKYPDQNIWCNVPLNPDLFKNFKPIRSCADLFDIEKHCFVGLDEDWHMADSLNSMSPEAKAHAIILLRSRKLDWDVGITEQWYTQIIKRLRFVIDLWIMPTHHQRSCILQEDIYDIFTNYVGTRYFDAKKLYCLYDSYADPLTLDIEQVKAEYFSKISRRAGGYGGYNR